MSLKKIFILFFTVFSVIPIILVAIGSSFFFSNKSNSILEQSIQHTSVAYCDQINDFFNQRNVNLNMIGDLSLTEDLLSQNKADSQTYQSVENALKAHMERQTFVQQLSLVNSQNKVVACNDSTVVGQDSSLTKSMASLGKNHMYVSDLLTSSDYKDGAKYWYAAVPVYKDSKYLGYVMATLDVSYFDKIISAKDFYKTGEIMIADSTGMLAGTENKYKFGSLNSNDIRNDLTEKWGELDLTKKTVGMLDYTVDDVHRIGFYSVVPSTNWIVFSTVSWQEVSASVQKNDFGVILAIVLLAIVMVVMSLLFFKKLQVPIKGFVNSMKKVQDGDYTTRFHYKKDNEFSVIAATFNQLMDRVVADTTALKEKEERYLFVLNNTEQIIFEWDVRRNIVQFSPNCKKLMGTDSLAGSLMDKIPPNSNVYYDDKPLYDEYFHHILSGDFDGILEVRLFKSDRSYIWCRINVNPIVNEAGVLCKVIGVITDIDAQKKELLKLQMQAQKDTFTGLYNKTATRSLIEKTLEESRNAEKHAFLILDIDNFKLVNDKFGHSCGDDVIKEVSLKIKQLFRSSDIIGRIGGDEFVIFMKNLASQKLLVKKLKGVCEIFHNSHLPDKSECSLSTSIGVAMYPEQGANFQELYQKADLALYESKRNGKNGYTLYSDDLVKEHPKEEIKEPIKEEQKPTKEAQEPIKADKSAETK